MRLDCRWCAVITALVLSASLYGCGSVGSNPDSKPTASSPSAQDGAPRANPTPPSPTSTLNPQAPPPALTAAPATAPATSSAQPGCKPVTTASALADLEALTDLHPSLRAEMATGEAQRILQEQAAFIREGWPAAYFNGWPSQAWTGVDLQQVDSQRTLVTLRHATPYSKTVTRFEWECAPGAGNGNWYLSQMGPESRWYTAAPVSVPSQSGELTEQNAMTVLNDVLMSYGTTRMRVSATGNELERGRLLAVAVAAGASLRPQYWGAKGITLQKEAPDRIIGRLKDEKGAFTGEQVLFTKVGALWKVADHTEEHTWAPVRRPGFEEPRDITHDLGFLGLALGMTSAQVQASTGQPDAVNGSTHEYKARGLKVEYGTNGTVVRIAATAGTTARGLTAGAPIASVEYLYGKPTERRPDALVYANGAQRLVVFVHKTVGATSDTMVDRFIFESMP